MKIASRFLTRPDPVAAVCLTVDGERVTAQPGDSVAAALLAQSGEPSRLSAQKSPRTAYCMMGVCFECLVEIDGRPNTQACMTQVRDGMVVRRPRGLRGLTGGGGHV
ncbi:(2Fe-2S)-binding protein [Pararhodobacter sp.]|uniref:(2Fe-2S)-binding protein n=1 Tax=Pararhodobacter sp. TaxID=2127056 RepID=UPI002AFEBC17|nr:(2Fe-2S)-binding protein [Pararhodobacter sp.]